ncbi:L-rhamnose-binding lectin CSL2-like [Patiria miniata]|uniref:SUEL-type lectin domain-containing protein n=1 Tax=Patiria miniata TaxID=46514 RepID=A0A913ZLQ8_PATMI|nr:L-rhamnose-binding lectin CSL2-like [Patiria miniata]
MRLALLILGVLVVTESCNICYMITEPDPTGKMRWVFPYPDPCHQCGEIRPGGVNMRAPKRAFKPEYHDSLLISSDPAEICKFLNCKPTLVCENSNFTISCDVGTIDVKWALYGREDGTIDCKINKAVPCGDPTTSLTTVQEACQGKPQCAFLAENDFFGGDPCQNVGKYLVVHYLCSWENVH